MTARQRMLAVYHGRLPDRTPVSIYGRYLPRGSLERELRNAGLGVIEYYPVASLLAPPWHLLPGHLSEVRDADLDIRYTWEDGVAIETRTYRTPVGTVWQRSQRDPGYGSDWITKFYIERPEDYRVVRFLVENTVLRSNHEAFRARKDDLGEDGVLLGRLDRSPFQKLLIELAGPERLHADLHEAPGMVSELLDALERRQDEAFAMALDSDIDVLWQPDNISADMTPPNCFQKYCFPFYQKRARTCRQVGKPYLVHMDGRLKALSNLIARCPIDAVESFSLPEIGGDLTLPEARALWPDKLILPNFPASLCLKPESFIESFLRGICPTPTGATPFMLQISEDIPPGEWKRVLPVVCSFLQSKT